jgi:hypothetical protein
MGCQEAKAGVVIFKSNADCTLVSRNPSQPRLRSFYQLGLWRRWPAHLPSRCLHFAYVASYIRTNNDNESRSNKLQQDQTPMINSAVAFIPVRFVEWYNLPSCLDVGRGFP